MKISAKIDYACRAILELSLHWPNTVPMPISAISRRQNIPIQFLTHILINLKQLGYVDSVRGKNGGYVLRDAPRGIRLSEVVRGLGGLENHRTQANKGRHVLDTVWQELDDVVTENLQKIDFEAICNRVRHHDKALIFEI